jgi:hypothetical protein
MANHFRRQIHSGKSIRKSQTIKSLDKNAVEILKKIKNCSGRYYICKLTPPNCTNKNSTKALPQRYQYLLILILEHQTTLLNIYFLTWKMMAMLLLLLCSWVSPATLLVCMNLSTLYYISLGNKLLGNQRQCIYLFELNKSLQFETLKHP